MIASTIVRASAKGLPLRPVGRGSMSSIIDHWASESTWNLDICSVSQDGRYIFVRHALGALIGGLKAARLADGDLRIAAATPAVMNVLKLTNLDKVLRAYESPQTAFGNG